MDYNIAIFFLGWVVKLFYHKYLAFHVNLPMRPKLVGAIWLTAPGRAMTPGCDSSCSQLTPTADAAADIDALMLGCHASSPLSHTHNATIKALFQVPGWYGTNVCTMLYGMKQCNWQIPASLMHPCDFIMIQTSKLITTCRCIIINLFLSFENLLMYIIGQTCISLTSKIKILNSDPTRWDRSWEFRFCQWMTSQNWRW